VRYLRSLQSLDSLTRRLAVDALIVGAETLSNYLRTKRTWTGRIVLLTDGESPIQIENWESIAKKLSSFKFRITIVCVLPTLAASIRILIVRSGVDFDDDEIDFHEEGKSHIKVTPTRLDYACCLTASISAKTKPFTINSLPLSPTQSWEHFHSHWMKLASQR
jgi:hypothetical protein